VQNCKVGYSGKTYISATDGLRKAKPSALFRKL